MRELVAGSASGPFEVPDPDKGVIPKVRVFDSRPTDLGANQTFVLGRCLASPQKQFRTG